MHSRWLFLVLAVALASCAEPNPVFVGTGSVEVESKTESVVIPISLENEGEADGAAASVSMGEEIAEAEPVLPPPPPATPELYAPVVPELDVPIVGEYPNPPPPEPAPTASGPAISQYVAPACGEGIRSWHTPERIDDLTNGTVLFYEVATDGHGGAMVVWHQRDYTSYRLFARQFVPGTGWKPAVLLENYPYGQKSPMFPKIVSDNQGNYLLVYGTIDTTPYPEIKGARFLNGMWESPQVLYTPPSPLWSTTYYPAIAMNANGDAVIVASEHSLESDGIPVVMRYSATSGWLPAERPNLGIKVQGPPYLAMSGDRTFLAWVYCSNTACTIRATSHTESAGWQSPKLLANNLPVDSSTMPSLATDAVGNALLVWRAANASYTTYKLWYSRFSAGVWQNAITFRTFTQSTLFNPTVLFTHPSNGEAIALWPRRLNTEETYRVESTRFQNGVWQSSNELIATGSTDAWSAQDAAADACGGLITIWGAHTEARVSRNVSGQWLAPEVVSDASPNWVQFPKLSVSPNGNAVVIWLREYPYQNGYRRSLWANEFY